MAYDEADVRWSPWWVLLWIINVGALCAMAFAGAAPKTVATWFMVLFMAPEMFGLWRHKDAFPPLTYVVARYVPNWMPHALTFGIGTWLGAVWWRSADHPLIAVTIIGLFVGWLSNHWTVTLHICYCDLRRRPNA